MKNSMIWGTQATVDYPFFTLSESQLFREILPRWRANNILTECRDELEKIEYSGMDRDREIEITKNGGNELKKAMEDLEKNTANLKRRAAVGGSPTISAIRGYNLGQGLLSLPEVRYIGLYPASVREYVEQETKYGPVFENAIYIDATPLTLSLELKNVKLMLSNREGRKLGILVDKEELFEKYLTQLERIVNQTEETKKGITVVALGGLSGGTPEQFGKLVKAIKGARFEKYKVKLFLGTNAFRGRRDREGKVVETKEELIRKYHEAVISKVDIVSFNDAELTDYYNAMYTPSEERSLAQKLRDLDLNAIKICHSAEGVILDLNINRPTQIINSEGFNDYPSRFIEEVLQLSSDGTSMNLDRGPEIGWEADMTQVEIYSKHIWARQEAGFTFRFVHPSAELPAGMIGVVAPRIQYPKGIVTGMGAVFDSLLLSFMMRD